MGTDKIRILDFITYPGRNIYCHRPIMKLIVDIGEYWDIPTKDIEGFHDRLLKAFPGLRKNCCSLGYEGGFLKRLKEGTYLAHVLEHVILEMQYMLGYKVKFGKTRVLEEPSVYYLVYEFQNEVCGLECGKTAVFILNCFLNGTEPDTQFFMDYLKKISIDAELGPSTTAIVQEAKRRNIPVTRIGHESLVQLGYGKYSRIVESTLTDATSCIAADISCNKQLTKTILAENHIPVPYGKVVYSEISAVIAAKQIGLPVVLKPCDGNQGKGVVLNLDREEDIKNAFREGCKYGSGVIVEKFVRGNDYRVLVVGNKVSAVAKRLPAMVVGDGKHTVRELVDLVNLDENRGEQHEKPLTKIKIDEISIRILENENLTVDSIPEQGRVVKLRANGNLSTGGTAIDCTDQIHPENAELAVRAAKSIGIDIAGIDIVTEDISKSILDTGGVIVEVNSAPGIRMHIYPSQGTPRNVAADIVDLLFPTDESIRFPIVSVTGTNGKTTTARLIAHTLSLCDRKVGLTSTSGTFVNGKCLFKGDHSGPRSAKTLLSNKDIDCAVLETARGGIIREGLGYDLADVGIVMNIGEDHLGMDGTETLEDLAYVKSLVTEAVKENGYAVLNAEDGMTPYLAERTRANIVLFSKNNRFEKIGKEEQIRVFAQDGWIRIQEKETLISLLPAADVPITCGGKIACNIENSLAATAALYALGIPADRIAQGLRSYKQNSGRFSLYDVNNFHVMLDYGHNLPGYQEVIRACKHFQPKRLVGVIGMPGDRSDKAIRSVGALCAESFDRIYIKEDEDKRGREPLEVANLFKSAILEKNYDEEKVTVIENELEALKAAVESADAGDLIVILYEKLEPLQEYLNAIGAKPAQ
ncbi:cyanophycin synthetase [Caproiciproducens galactitolivorans]|uniref:cyanophycin synthetase n=1 Tax=Caproiciproducens galactitolivorans TaxID=642589 RepID=UPI002409C2B9|nr:cyanophycin synthetase [Caproiciproducens galactitolivorans]